MLLKYSTYKCKENARTGVIAKVFDKDKIAIISPRLRWSYYKKKAKWKGQSLTTMCPSYFGIRSLIRANMILDSVLHILTTSFQYIYHLVLGYIICQKCVID